MMTTENSIVSPGKKKRKTTGLDILTGRHGKIPRWQYWMAIMAMSAVQNLSVYGIINEGFIGVACGTTGLTIAVWLWFVAGVVRSRDMGPHYEQKLCYALAFLTLIPIFGWVTVVYLGAVKDESAEYNPL